MWEWIELIGKHWPGAFANVLVDYVNENIIGGIFTRTFGGWGGAFVNGLGFTAKQAAYDTSYFQSTEGWSFGWVSNMFGAKGSDTTQTAPLKK